MSPAPKKPEPKESKDLTAGAESSADLSTGQIPVDKPATAESAVADQKIEPAEEKEVDPDAPPVTPSLLNESPSTSLGFILGSFKSVRDYLLEKHEGTSVNDVEAVIKRQQTMFEQGQVVLMDAREMGDKIWAADEAYRDYSKKLAEDNAKLQKQHHTHQPHKDVHA